MNQIKLWNRDFNMVVLGQIISLFGNAILRFALPLHLLNVTHSSTLFGAVSACAILPMILLSPIGGMIADRVNKRNVMVVLDFATSALILIFMLLLGRVDLVVLFVITLMLLYGIQGAYQPAVQASLPVLQETDNLLTANAVINQVNSLAGLIGPVVGGALYSFFGIWPILWVSSFCFFCSAVLEIFIHIPFTRKKAEAGILSMVRQDFKESFAFIRSQTIVGKVLIIVAIFNLVLSSLIIVGMPVMITQMLSFESTLSSQLYGYAQGVLAVGGILGGVLTGILAKKLKLNQAYLLLAGAALLICPMGIVFLVPVSAWTAYFTIAGSCFGIMMLSTMFSIQMLTFVQILTPPDMIGKIISCVLALAMCAQPVGQAIYGKLFSLPAGQIPWILFGAGGIGIVTALISCNIFQGFKQNEETASPTISNK